MIERFLSHRPVLTAADVGAAFAGLRTAMLDRSAVHFSPRARLSSASKAEPRSAEVVTLPCNAFGVSVRWRLRGGLVKPVVPGAARRIVGASAYGGSWAGAADVTFQLWKNDVLLVNQTTVGVLGNSGKMWSGAFAAIDLAEDDEVRAAATTVAVIEGQVLVDLWLETQHVE
jgi:hypothetical protein